MYRKDKKIKKDFQEKVLIVDSLAKEESAQQEMKVVSQPVGKTTKQTVAMVATTFSFIFHFNIFFIYYFSLIKYINQL